MPERAPGRDNPRVEPRLAEPPHSPSMPAGQRSAAHVIEALYQTILSHQKVSVRQARAMVRLGWIMTALALVMLIAVGAQIFLSVIAAGPAIEGLLRR